MADDLRRLQMVLVIVQVVDVMRSHLDYTWSYYIRLEWVINNYLQMGFDEVFPSLVEDLRMVRHIVLGYLENDRVLNILFSSIISRLNDDSGG